MTTQSVTRILALGSAAMLIVGCSDRRATGSIAPSGINAASSFVARPGEPGAPAERMLFQVTLRPEGGFRSEGVMLFEIVGGHFTARVQAAGLEPLQRIPQHIHLNPTCTPGGGILINLDETLTVAGEGPGVGAAYPLSNNGGVINYRASRSLRDLLNAVNTFLGANLGTVDELLTWLDLDNRNGHMHVPFGPPFPAVNCGEIERIN